MLHDFWTEWVEWWTTLPPEFAFLLALPFAVAAAGLASDWIGRHPDEKHSSRPRFQALKNKSHAVRH